MTDFVLYLLLLPAPPLPLLSPSSWSLQKVTTNAIFLIGYALGQTLCSQFWKLRYRPHNTVPWAITLVRTC